MSSERVDETAVLVDDNFGPAEEGLREGIPRAIGFRFHPSGTNGRRSCATRTNHLAQTEQRIR